LTRPMIRKNGKFEDASWEEALSLVAVKIKEIGDKYGAGSVGCAVSTKYTNEDLFQVKKFFQTILSSDNVVHFESSAYPGIQYHELDKASTIVVVGCDLTRENPVAGSYVKQAVLHGVKLIVVDSRETDIARFAKVHLNDLSDPSAVEKFVDGNNIIVIRHPQYDITPLNKMNNVKIFTLTRENNTVGAYFMGIKAGDEFDLSSKKFMYSMGGHFKNRGSVEFLVVQDLFRNEYTDAADVILPAAVWVEYEGTYISSDARVNRVRKAVDPPGEARPAWRIFKDLAGQMGYTWESDSSREIWENEIGPQDPHLGKINYRKLDEGDGIKIDKGHFISFKGANVLPEGIDRPDDHKILCSYCEDMENVFKKLF
jgi:predicted molibdopterin-dependent oxidoreductase YjgC